MISTYDIYEELMTTVDEKTAKTLTKILTRVYEDVKNTPTKQDVMILQNSVNQLTDAQLKTEQTLTTLIQKVEGLAEAQQKTEQRLDALTMQMQGLAEAQQKTEQRLDALTMQMQGLAEAQQKTDIKIQELIEAQKTTDLKIQELIESQIKIVKRLDAAEERIEGLSNSVGYSLENSAYKALPQLLEAFGIKVTEKIIRKYVNGYQVNIFAKAQKEGKNVYLLGECKVRPSKKEIDRFLKIFENLKKHLNAEEFIPIFVAHDYPPEIESYINTKGIIYFWSYEF